MKKKIAILGITGSIGTSAVEIVSRHSDLFEVVFASAHSQYDQLLSIAQRLNIQKIALTQSESKTSHTDPDIRFYKGQSELLKLITSEGYDILINAVTGSAGLPYTIATLQAGRDLALANKESLVMAGHLIKNILKSTPNPPKLLPVDSEHSAIFQVLQGQHTHSVRYLHITASGGPFRTLPLNDFAKIAVENALNHPTWSMGPKVTIDSATMMNKGLEVIEAHWLFSLPYDKLKAIIHPQSIIHSLVEFKDGSILAQMSNPTMQLPILYALTYPERVSSECVHTSLEKLSALTFETIDSVRYPLFYLAINAGLAGGIMPTVLNAANEVAVERFLRGEIGFMDIVGYVERMLGQYENVSEPDLGTILEVNAQIRASSPGIN